MLNLISRKLNYFGDNSVLHGVGRVFSMKHIHILKRLFWLTMLIACGVGAYMMLKAVIGLYGKSVSFSLETTYLDFETPFPAVTVCEYPNYQRVPKLLTDPSVKNLTDAQKTSLGTFYREIMYWNNKFCKVCEDCQQAPETCAPDVQKAIESYRFKCTEILGNCSWDGQQFPCCERFRPMLTDYGTCFSFNSRQTDNVTDVLVVDRSQNPRLEINATEWIEIRVHSPDDLLSVLVDDIVGETSRSIFTKTEFEILLSVEQTVNDVSVLALEPSVRGCLMHWERPTFTHHWPYTRYSTANCELLCRTVAQIEACNCTYHFAPKLAGVDKCGTSGLACLFQNNKNIFAKKCSCLPECDEISYKVIHMFNERFKTPYTHGVIRILQLPSVRVRRHVIRDRVSLVVDVGGVGGVFFGASVLGIIEILYLLCFRINWK